MCGTGEKERNSSEGRGEHSNEEREDLIVESIMDVTTTTLQYWQNHLGNLPAEQQ